MEILPHPSSFDWPLHARLKWRRTMKRTIITTLGKVTTLTKGVGTLYPESGGKRNVIGIDRDD